MSCYKLFLFFSIISLSYLMKDVSGLRAEAIANGRPANYKYFKYHAVIFGRTQEDATNYVRCNGAIVSPKFILCIAHCFMLTSDIQKGLIFTAVVGTDDMSHLDPSRWFDNIIMIYTYHYNSAYRENDIAMAELKNALHLGDILDKIAVAPVNFAIDGVTAVVSGFGYSEIRKETRENGTINYVKSDPDLTLKFTGVQINKASTCTDKFSRVSSNNKVCGKTGQVRGQYTGVCWNDAGGPLVYDNHVVGLSSSCYDSCDDTDKGSLYMEVSKYFEFIQSVINFHPIRGVERYQLELPPSST